MNFAQKSAYSILEVLVAIWLLVFVGGSLVATFAYLIKTASVAADQAAAELLADELLERAAKSGPPTWGLPDLSGTRTVQAEVGGDSNYDWVLNITELGDSGLGKLYKLEAQIDWTAHIDSVERGSRKLSRTRHVYLERP